MRLFDVKWKVKTAGPSPFNNERTELFLLGCRKAMEGNPCPECFNSPTWDESIAKQFYTPTEIAEHLSKTAPNKYVTIGGGEPTDQIDELIVLCKELKKYGFHVMVYTWRDLKWELGRNESDHADFPMGPKLIELLRHIDMLVDGEFKLEERVYNEDAGDGTFNSVGSGNQVIWDARGYNKSVWPQSVNIIPFVKGYAMKDVTHLKLDDNDDLIYILKDNAVAVTAPIR